VVDGGRLQRKAFGDETDGSLDTGVTWVMLPVALILTFQEYFNISRKRGGLVAGALPYSKVNVTSIAGCRLEYREG